jgi:hypothetical protein
MELVNRNSTAKQQQSVWEMISNTWNDPSFAPQTEVIQDLHQNFVVSDKLEHRLVEEMAPATPDKCRVKFSNGPTH